jgi:hypothetical protein
LVSSGAGYAGFDVAKPFVRATASSRCMAEREDMYIAAVRHARLRTEWDLAPGSERGQMDATRTRAHDILIDAYSILSRAMARAGEDNEWRRSLGSDGGVIGDAACTSSSPGRLRKNRVTPTSRVQECCERPQHARYRATARRRCRRSGRTAVGAPRIQPPISQNQQRAPVPPSDHRRRSSSAV